MKRAKTEIIATSRGEAKYFFSIVEKENDSGIFFNQRLFFLLSEQHIGYISDIKANDTPEMLNFQKPKTTVLLKNIKSIVVNLTQLSIKFNLIDGNRKSERTWILRMEKEELTRQWYDLLQREKIASSSSRLPSPKKSESPEPWRLSPKKVPASPEKKKEFAIIRHIELSENVAIPKEPKEQKEYKEVKEFKEVGIGVSPKSSQIKKFQWKDPQQRLRSIINKRHQEEDSSRLISIKREAQIGSQKSIQITIEKQVQKLVEKSVQRLSQRPKIQPIEIPKSIITEKPVQKIETSQQTFLNTSRQNLSEEKATSNGEKMLINTMYLTGQKPTRSRDYLDRTHQLIRSFDQDNEDKDKHSRVSKSRISEVAQPILEADEECMSPKQQKSLQKKKEKGLPWTYRYVAEGAAVLKEFQKYASSLMEELVQDQSRRREAVRFKPKLIKNGVHYFDIADLEVKLALIGLEDLESPSESLETERVCNGRAVKLVQNEFNNLLALYQWVGNEGKLHVPLACLCYLHGFVALFKATCQPLKRTARLKDVENELLQLERRSGIRGNFLDPLSNLIVQLDESYYQALQPPQSRSIDFHLFFIQEVEDYLLPDLITDSPQQDKGLLRKELLQRHPPAAPVGRQGPGVRGRALSREAETLSRSVLGAIAEVIVEMDTFRVYFLGSAELSAFLHSVGVNIRYLGHLQNSLRAPWQRRIVMTEMAARSCKTLFRKTLQDIMAGEDVLSGQELLIKVCDFLNCVLGNTFETAAIWKVLSSHSKAYFGKELDFDQIDRCHFVLSIIQNLRLDVAWQRIKPEEAFKSNLFFSQKNLLGLASFCKSYRPIHSDLYRRVRRVLDSEPSYEGFQILVRQMELKIQPIPAELHFLEEELKGYLCLFISPTSQEYPHLSLYHEDGGAPTRSRFEQLLAQVRWALREERREDYVRICEGFIRTATRFFGEFHPLFSELYDVFSAYHLSRAEFEDAVTFAKSSLVNLLRVCGGSHQRTAEGYFHLALCYARSGRREEALAHMRKALSILESNSSTGTPMHATMQVKLGLLLLSQGQAEQCVKLVSSAQSVFQAKSSQVAGGFQQQITQCLQVLHRCYQLLQWAAQKRQLLEGCEMRLHCTTNASNLQRLLKVFLHPQLAGLTPEAASLYLDIISALAVVPTQHASEMALGLLRSRIAEGSLSPCLRMYLGRVESIEQHIREKGMLRGWVNFSQIYERQTVKDFLSLTVELLAFLGQGFMTGALREAL